MGSYTSAPSTYDDAKHKAAERNLEVRIPRSNELFVDIDNARDYSRFKVLVEMLGQVEPIQQWSESSSASGGEHRHIVVTLVRHVTNFERIALQAMLASDLKREILSYQQYKNKNTLYPTLFFEPKAGAKSVARKTGFNCRGCNFRNEYAEANQEDGTYVCFNCRVGN